MLHVLLEPASPRTRYAVRHVFERMLGWPVVFVPSREDLRASPGPRLSIGEDPVDGILHLSAIGPALATGIHAPGPRANLFADVFHLLSLQEEYATSNVDEHGRIRTENLSIVRAGVHDAPVIDKWVLDLADRLRGAIHDLPMPARTYTHVLSVDVDNGLKYAARSFQRAIGASAKDILTGKPERFAERWRVRAGMTADPYRSFVRRLSETRGQVQRMIAFCLTKGEGRYDHAARLEHPVFLSLLKELAQVAEIGLHPSYESSRNEPAIAQERARLQAAAGMPVHLSRQHFLRWQLPGTFRALIAAGITEDHSVGFSDRIGFRAGTCTPFPWYDLEREEETTLMLHPFAAMDSALAQEQGAELLRAVGAMKSASDAVRAVGGTFISVWHDRFLSGHGEFKGGPETMRELVEHAKA